MRQCARKRKGVAQLTRDATVRALVRTSQMNNAGRVISREEILDTLWGVDYVAGSNVVDRQIRNLRAHLHDHWKRPRVIETIPGQGYRFLPLLSLES